MHLQENSITVKEGDIVKLDNQLQNLGIQVLVQTRIYILKFGNLWMEDPSVLVRGEGIFKMLYLYIRKNIIRD